jgi:hypothetical protein
MACVWGIDMTLRPRRDFANSKSLRKNLWSDVDFAIVARRTGEGRKAVIYAKEEGTMQYLLLIYENEKRFSQGYDQAEMAEYRAFGQEFAKSIKGGHALQPTHAARTVRVRNGKPLTTDGPFAETKEQLGGYYLVEAADGNEAIAIAAKIPGARFGSIEVRPIMTFS